MFGSIFGCHNKKVFMASSGFGGGRDAVKHPTMPRKAPTVKSCWLKMSIVLILRNPAFSPSYNNDPYFTGQVIDFRVLPESMYICPDHAFENQGNNCKVGIQNH